MAIVRLICVKTQDNLQYEVSRFSIIIKEFVKEGQENL